MAKGIVKIIKSDSGVALMMVLSAIAILTVVLATFTFDTKVNRLKIYNQQDRSQAKLNAEAGISLAMARLRLYKEGRNLLEKNKDAKKVVKHEVLNFIWDQPFKYPIDLGEGANLIQKSALEEFEKETLVNGEMQVVITNESQKINLNLLRVKSAVSQNDPNGTDNSNTTDSSSNSSDGSTDVVNIDNELVKMLKQAMEEKKEDEKDGDRFSELFGHLDPEELIATIKYYVSDKESYDDHFVSAMPDKFDRISLQPKHGPMTSLSELYLLPDWADEIVELIKNSVTVHGAVTIDINKITDKTLKLLFPEMGEEQVEDFFKYRDGDEDGLTHYFETLDDFKTYITSTANVMTKAEFEKREKEFEKAGLKFGAKSSLFQIFSTGKYGRAEYTISSFVALPAKPLPTPTPTPSSNSNSNSDATAQATPSPTATGTPTPPPLELLNPRTLELKGD
ncbi:MAG: hypothetical protein HOE90_18455 [Bacteriovoracaceae bacterium]|jgi:hypothetical protein|nr:hypothetical protein [Bacteriovoracaceae bacterium]